MPKDRLLSVTGASVGAGNVGPPPPEPPAPPEPLLPPAPPAPPAPVVPPHDVVADAELRVVTEPAVKSDELSSLSVHPEPARLADVVLLSVGVGPLPSKLDADEP